MCSNCVSKVRQTYLVRSVPLPVDDDGGDDDDGRLCFIKENKDNQYQPSIRFSYQDAI